MEIRDCIRQFAVEGEVKSVQEYGSGHINSTSLVETEYLGKPRRYIFQRINTQIFHNVDQLMENITGVTNYLRKELMKQGKDASRQTLQVIPTLDGGSYFRDGDGSCYRMYDFIEDAYCLDAVQNAADFYQSGLAFGNFQFLLAGYPAHTLHETIPDFHHTGKRYQTFCQVLAADVKGRAALAGPEIAFVQQRAKEMTALTRLQEAGELPLRVTHNDTKLNNIMIDKQTGEGLCVIDLDTVMPGLSLYDFGDAIRFGANTAAEDEQDLIKVSLDLDLYEQYVKGYLTGCQGSLTKREIELLPMGAKLMTLECGMRFLADYLEGDVYFKIHRPGHNLDRCRTQFALVADMEQKWEQMAELIGQYTTA